jgi:hypothetical protein
LQDSISGYSGRKQLFPLVDIHLKMQVKTGGKVPQSKGRGADRREQTNRHVSPLPCRNPGYFSSRGYPPRADQGHLLLSHVYSFIDSVQDDTKQDYDICDKRPRFRFQDPGGKSTRHIKKIYPHRFRLPFSLSNPTIRCPSPDQSSTTIYDNIHSKIHSKTARMIPHVC